MKLTVCICTHDRPADVAQCLEGLHRQTTPQQEFAVLLVDSGSGDDTAAQLHALADAYPGACLLRLDRPGLSAARNAGARAARTPFIAYVDDDAVPAPDWIASILAALEESPRPPALLGGRVLPLWDMPLPVWWPRQLRGVLSIVEAEGRGEFRTAALPADLAPCGANLVVQLDKLHAVGGFNPGAGRSGRTLLSDEEVQLAWRLQQAGHAVRYDSRLLVRHRIGRERLTPGWLLSRLYWQGASTVLTRRALGCPGAVWRELPRRLLVLLACAPAALVPRASTRAIGWRWRLAYASGFVRAAFGWPLAPRDGALRCPLRRARAADSRHRRFSPPDSPATRQPVPQRSPAGASH